MPAQCGHGQGEVLAVPRGFLGGNQGGEQGVAGLALPAEAEFAQVTPPAQCPAELVLVRGAQF